MNEVVDALIAVCEASIEGLEKVIEFLSNAPDEWIALKIAEAIENAGNKTDEYD